MKHIHFFLPLFLSFYQLLSRCKADAVEFAACNLMQYRCGDNTYDVKFPFCLPESMPDYCGSKGFDLTCVENETLMINITSESYQVKSIDYATNVLTVVNPDLVSGNQPCPQRVTNTTLDFSPFTYAAFDHNLTFYANCSSAFTFPWLIPANCTEFGPNNYYFSVNETPPIVELLQSCTSVGVFVINQTAASDLSEGGRTDIGDALQGGFGVNWTSGTEWCDGCQSSGGMCGSTVRGNSSAPNCFCPNGMVSSGNVCKQQGITSGTKTVTSSCPTY